MSTAKCGNCRGSGQIKARLKGGRVHKTPCPTCDGSGTVASNDPRRSPK